MVVSVREGPQVGTSLARLNVALPALNAVITIMSLREGDKSANEEHSHGHGVSGVAPPTYQTSEFLHLRRMRRNRPSGYDTTTTSGSEAWRSDQSMERAAEVPPYPSHLNSFAGIHELEGSQAYLLPAPPRQDSTSRDIPNCLRAGPTARQLFDPVEDTRRRRSRIAWSNTYSEDADPDYDQPRSPTFREPSDTGHASRNYYGRLQYIEETGEGAAARSQSWRAYQASLPS